MSRPTKRLPVVGGATVRNRDRLKGRLAARKSSDIVCALVGYLGSGVSRVAGVLSEQAISLGFEPVMIRLSDEIAKRSDTSFGTRSTITRTRALQAAGDKLRKNHGESIVAGLGIKKIRDTRNASESEAPRVFILDSLKHPSEVHVLRETYGSSFYLITVICNESTRRERLQLKYKNEPPGSDPKHLMELMQDDRKGSEKYGQHVRKTAQLADLFVVNEGGHDLAEELDRFLLALTGREIVRPTRNERGMHAAWAASLRSSCLSRQVGAAIVGPSGELLATGANDPPAPGGGVYRDGDHYDRRCFKWKEGEPKGFCRNDRQKDTIYAAVYEKMRGEGLLSSTTDAKTLAKALAATRIGALIEFSRAIHAEMDAILELARNGKGIPPGSSLFCRAYPCHNCARHLVAAGISEVVCIEPYDKSMALELHADAIRDVSVPEPKSDDPRVVFRLFKGVAPRRYAALFEKRRELKGARGTLLELPNTPEHADPVLTGSFLDLEKELAADVEDALGS